MQNFFSTLGYGFLALLAVAMIVAAIEHVVQQKRARLPPPPTAPARAAHLDVDLGTLESARPDTDQDRRQSAMGTALSRMSRQPTPADGQGPWTETRPMVTPGTPVETETH